jgi:hypothetical protein
LTVDDHARRLVGGALRKGNGILRLEPAWVARELPPPGYRLACVGFKSQYDVGERGSICERWFASVTRADNRVGPSDEGLSYITLDGQERLTLKAAVDVAGDLILGCQYAAAHSGLGRLFKIYDFATRIPYHLHPQQKHTALIGRNPKEEAYYFPEEIDMGPHPESFFGVHPWIAEQRQYDALLPYLQAWDSELILRYSRAYLLVPGEGFHLPSGVPHAPGTAVTLELQEDSDVSAMLQASVEGHAIPKGLLFKDVRPADRAAYGERFVLDMIDWETSGDPYFYENRHLTPQLTDEQPGGREHWIFYNTTKFSGKRLVVQAGQTFTSTEKGVYSVLVWKGRGRYGGHDVEAGDPGRDELLISHDRAMQPTLVENLGSTDLVVIKIFGPDINPDVPMITPYLPGR